MKFLLFSTLEGTNWNIQLCTYVPLKVEPFWLLNLFNHTIEIPKLPKFEKFLKICDFHILIQTQQCSLHCRHVHSTLAGLGRYKETKCGLEVLPSMWCFSAGQGYQPKATSRLRGRHHPCGVYVLCPVRTWMCACSPRNHPYITSAYFWTFSDPPTQYSQHKYSTECQHFSEPTHSLNSPFADVMILYWIQADFIWQSTSKTRRFYFSGCTLSPFYCI